MTVAIRLLGERDIEAFKAIRIEALTKEPDAFASTVDDWLVLSEQEWRQRTIGNPVIVAFEGDTPVGIMGLMPERASKRRHRATLIMVYIRKEHRGAGLADRLLDAVMDHACAIGVEQVELGVNADNAQAIRFTKGGASNSSASFQTRRWLTARRAPK